jgi:hypothetical protein
MAKVNERIMEFVRREIAKDPDISSTSLYEKAKKLDRSISRLDLRQFHARYPLQVKRGLKSGKGGAGTSAAGRRGGRGAVQRAPVVPGRRRGRPPKRASAGAVTAGPAAAPSAAPSRSRDAVRDVLLEFASSVARIENKADMIGLVSGVDGWVDRVVSASR